MQNFFAQSPRPEAPEQTDVLFRAGAVRIERIVSNGEASPTDFWYDQDADEWVMLLEGTAALQFADGESLQLTRGDYLLIPAHRAHRVSHTSADAVWLAVHFGAKMQTP